MTNKIFMPALSPTMTEGILSKWLVKIGDKIKAGDILAEIETDKATMEVEAVDEGILTQIIVNEGSKSVAVNSVIAILDGRDEDVKENEDSKENKKITDIEKENQEESINKIEEPLNQESFSKNDTIQKNTLKNFNSENKIIIASPYVKSKAKKEGINLSNLYGSGPNGRIIKRDLENNKLFIKEDNVVSSSISSMRKIIAERTTLTKQTVPHFYLTIESDVDTLLEMRKKINLNSDNKISINDILVKALAHAQKLNPLTNVSWDNGKIIKNNSIDVSIAVALQEGLITPILKNADKKGLNQISIEIKELTNKAKKGKLLPDEYNGGTISISNLGMYGISEFLAIINPPQSSILAVGAIKLIPRFKNNEIRAVNVLKSSLSADHRVLDGVIAGKLLKDFSNIIENPFDLWVMSKDMEII